LGRWVAVAELGKLRFLDTDQWAASHEIKYDVTDLFGAGGGLGIARMGTGSYLLIATRPGSLDPGPRRNYFWRLDGSIRDGLSVTNLGSSPYKANPAWDGTFEFSENLSVITECETGQIYTVHALGRATSGDWHCACTLGKAGSGNRCFAASTCT
jgi:hypothetical protein